MIELENLTLKDYFELEDKSEFDFAIKYGYTFNKGIDVFEIGDITYLTFKQVKDLQDSYYNGINWMDILELINQVKGTPIKQLAKNNLVDMCQFKSYLVLEIERVNEIESLTLGHEPDSDQKEAGIEELSVLGVFWQYDELTNGDITKMETVEDLKYTNCFLKLVANKRAAEFKDRLFEIKTKKYKH